MEDRFRIDLGSILAAQRAPKSRPGGSPDAPSDVHQSQMEQKRVLASFFSCLINIAMMQSDCKNRCVFEDFDFVTIVVFAYHLSSRRLKNHFKIGVQDVPKPFQNALRYQLRVGSASMTALERFWAAQ